MASKTCNVDNAELEHLEYYENNSKRHKDERDLIQKKTFTKWVNKHLRKVSRTVEDLFVDLRDGHNLISLLEVLSAEDLLRENGRTHFHRVQNIKYSLDWLKMKNIRLVNIRPEDIVEGNGKLTLGLIWTIILNFQVSFIKHRQRADAQTAAAVRAAAGAASGGGDGGTVSQLNASMNTTLEALEGRSAKEALLAWNQRATEGYARVRVANFTTSWRDGRAFSAILHRARPSAIDWEMVNGSSMTNRERLENAFEVAKREFDVDKLLDPEDVDRDAPDEKSIITYVSTIYQALPNLPETTKAPSAVSDDEVARWTAWAARVLARLECASLAEGGVREAGLARIETSSGEGGVEATVKRETEEVAVVMTEIELTRASFEAFLLVLGGETGENQAMAAAELTEQWRRITLLVSTRQRSLEASAARKAEVEGELASLLSWLSVAEMSLAGAGPISRLSDGQETQRREQSELVEEIERRRAAFSSTISIMSEIRASCAAENSVIMENQTAEERLRRLTVAAQERSEQLDSAAAETAAWQDGVTALEGWMDEMERKPEVTVRMTMDVGRLRSALEEAKATASAISSRRVKFEQTRKRALALLEAAPKSEKREFERKIEEMRKRWESVSAAADSRCAEVEKAVVEGGAFTEGLANLERWLDEELKEGAVRKEKGCRGDVDTVDKLLSVEKALEEARREKAESIEVIRKKVDSLVAEGVEEAPAISDAVIRLEKKWKEMDDEGKRRMEELERGMEEAKDCDGKVYGVLEWLVELEGKLEVPPSSDLSTGLAAAGSVRAALAAERPRLEEVKEACAAILNGCHPEAEAALKEWRRVVEARWKEVEELAAATEEALRGEQQRQGQKSDESRYIASIVEGEQLREWADGVLAVLTDETGRGGLKENNRSGEQAGRGGGVDGMDGREGKWEEGAALAEGEKTASGKMEEWREMKGEIDQNRPAMEAFLARMKREQEAGAVIGVDRAELEAKWDRIKDLASTRERKLVAAAEGKAKVEGELMDFSSWLDEAEKSLAVAGPISRLPEVLEGQMVEQEERIEEIERRRAAFMETKSLVDNRAAELENRLAALIQGVQERSEQLDAATEETATWLYDVTALEEWMNEMERKTAALPPASLDADRLAGALEQAQATVADISARRLEFEQMRQRGIALMDRAPRHERSAFEGKIGQMRERLESVAAAASASCAQAESAVMEGGAFTEALADLEEWLDRELDEGAVRKEKGCRGDVDTVAALWAAEKQCDEVRRAKDEVIGAIVRKAGSLAAAGVDEAPAVAAAADRLVAMWTVMEDEAAKRREELERAMEEAKECDAQVYGLLGWLVELEERLEVPPSSDLSTGLAAAGSVRAALAAERPRLEEVKEACAAILNGCHPEAEGALKEWRRVVEARWKEVEDQAEGTERSLLEEDERRAANEQAAEAMREFEEGKAREEEESRWEAESVGEEMDAVADEVLAVLESSRPLPGAPDTAAEQMDEFAAIKAQIDETGLDIGKYLSGAAAAAAAAAANVEESDGGDSWLARNRGALEAKWDRIRDLASTRQRTLEAAAERAEQLDAELVTLRSWLAEAEKSLADAGPISRLPEVLEGQRREQEERMEEIERRRASFLDTKALAGQIRASCDVKDAIFIKNQTVTLDGRIAKFVQRAQERSKQLDAAVEQMGAWLEGVAAIEEWIDKIKRKTDVAPPTTSHVDRLRATLEEAKTTVADVASRRPQFEAARRRGASLMEHAPKHERREIEQEIGEFRERWEAVVAAADYRWTEAERALLEGGAFTEALANLEEWLDGELEEGAERKEKGCRGDVDTVTELVYAEKKREEARRKKAETLDAIKKKAESLVVEGVEEAPAISAAAQRLEKKWKEMEEEAKRRMEELERGMEEAKECDAKARGLLEWLTEMEGRLEVPPSSDLATGLAAAGSVRAALAAERPRLEEVKEACEAILNGCHPEAEAALKEWRRVVEARWKEVEDAAAAREQSLLEEEQRQRAREAALHEMNEYVERKRLELDEASLQSSPCSLEQAEERVRAHADYERELRERQADVDALTKGRRRDGERDRAAEALGDRWRALWADSIGRAAQLEQDRALHAELRRLEGWQYADWRDRYVEWNDHAKARVNDLFRRLDRSATGSVPKEAFVEAIISSKFPTSRLEMAKVTEKFDKGDGQISAKEFINSLKIGSKVHTPRTPEEQKQLIKKEMTRRKEQCCCAHKFRIDHEEDTPGKVRPKSDGGVLQTYRFGDQQIRRMVRILHTTVMVRVGGGWEPLDEFLEKHDPCKAKDRTNTALHARFYDDVRPAHATDKMYDFTKLQHARGDYGSATSNSVTSPLARSSPKESVTVLRPFAQTGTTGVVKGIREKTERSVPMFGSASRERRAASMELLDSFSPRPSSRAGAELSDTPTRIPSLRTTRKGGPATTRRLNDVTNRSPFTPNTVPRTE